MERYTEKSIADRLGVSEKTVEFHLNNADTKISVRGSVLAPLVAIRQANQQEPKK